jgi:hypothetical protein
LVMPVVSRRSKHDAEIGRQKLAEPSERGHSPVETSRVPLARVQDTANAID